MTVCTVAARIVAGDPWERLLIAGLALLAAGGEYARLWRTWRS